MPLLQLWDHAGPPRPREDAFSLLPIWPNLGWPALRAPYHTFPAPAAPGRKIRFPWTGPDDGGARTRRSVSSAAPCIPFPLDGKAAQVRFSEGTGPHRAGEYPTAQPMLTSRAHANSQNHLNITTRISRVNTRAAPFSPGPDSNALNSRLLGTSAVCSLTSSLPPLRPAEKDPRPCCRTPLPKNSPASTLRALRILLHLGTAQPNGRARRLHCGGLRFY